MKSVILNRIGMAEPVPVDVYDYLTDKIIKTFNSYKECAVWAFRNPQKARYISEHIFYKRTKMKLKKYHNGLLVYVKLKNKIE